MRLAITSRRGENIRQRIRGDNNGQVISNRWDCFFSPKSDYGGK